MEKWHTIECDEVVRLLEKTRASTVKRTNQIENNISASGKRHLKRKHKSNNVFKIYKVDPYECLKATISDATLPVFIIVLIVSAFINNASEAISVFLCLAFLIMWSAILTYNSKRRLSGMASYLIPTARLHKDGRMVPCLADEIAQGDIISLKTGDVVPADARLLSSNDLVVLESLPTENTPDAKKTVRSIAKDADLIYSSEAQGYTYANMVYAGSSVAAGSGVAIVTDVGDNTRVGIINAGIPLMTGNGVPQGWMTFRRRTRLFSLVVLISVIPAMLVWLVSSGGRGDSDIGAFAAFLLFAALAVTSMSEISVTPSVFLYSETIRFLEKKKDVFVVRPETLESLAEVDTVLILNKASVCDAEQKVRSVFLGGKSFNNTTDADVIPEWFLKKIEDVRVSFDENRDIYKHPMFSSIRCVYRLVEDRNSMDSSKMNQNHGTTNDDRDAVYPLHMNQPIKNAVTAIKKIDREGVSEKRLITVSADPDIISYCDNYRLSASEAVPLTNKIQDKLFSTIQKYERMCLKTYILTSSDNIEDGLTLDGIVAVGIAFPKKNREYTAALKAYGVDTFFVIPEKNDFAVEVARNSGIAVSSSEIACATDPSPNDAADIQKHQNTRVWVGYGNEVTAQLIKKMSDSGRKILPVIRDAGQLKLVKEIGNTAVVEGASHDSIGMHSSVKLPKAEYSSPTGGLSAILDLIKESGASILKCRALSDYMFISTILRICAVIFPLLGGRNAGVPGLMTVILGGFLGDIIALMIISGSRVIPQERFAIKKISSKPVRALKVFGLAVAGILTGLCIQAVPQLFVSAGIIEPETLKWYNFCSILFSQIALLGAQKISWKMRGSTVRFDPFYLIVSMMVVAIGAVGAILSPKIGLSVAALKYAEGMELSWLIALIPAVLCALLTILSDSIVHRSSAQLSD